MYVIGLSILAMRRPKCIQFRSSRSRKISTNSKLAQVRVSSSVARQAFRNLPCERSGNKPSPRKALQVPQYPFKVPVEGGEGFLDQGLRSILRETRASGMVLFCSMALFRTALCPASSLPRCPNAEVQILTRQPAMAAGHVRA